ncbi:serine/threonine-protein kinase [Streptomyces sp. NPDC046197]|uniref:serine/threonine-protein kinase n=1 Tax=Streptomyces sp. NPDC046197 TaxID=3154337 RepID=UPI0033D4AB63
MAGTNGAAGRLIAGRYRLVHYLGAGGMGRVWLAQDEELACKVAVKEITVPQEIPEQELNARIARARGEARHSALLRGNPHVVTVYDCVVDAGLPWIIMEYVPGARNLQAVIRDSGPLSPSDTARLGLAVLDALMAGHQLGILHRDVKPSNILLTVPQSQAPDSARLGRILLSDYGISLQRDVGEPRLTTASGIVGTPGYLAPERARGAEPTPESDLFSLGATLYYAVEGHGPFDRSSYVSTLTALLTDEPPRPSRAGDLAPVLLKLLAKDPAHRLSADAAVPLFRELTTEAGRAPQQTVTEMPRPIKRPSAPGPPPRPPQPETAEPAPTPHPSRKVRRNIALAATASLVIGLGVWALVAGLSGPHKPSLRPSPRPTSTGQVMPYGDAVGLTRELRPGDCVNAAWVKEKFVGPPPKLGLTDCTAAAHDGQVLDTDPASSLDDAKENGNSRCEQLLAETVNAMADAQPYALPPIRQGWDGGVHNTACLIFDKTTTLSGNVGRFRKIGDGSYLDTGSIGDCWSDKDGNSYLAQCDAPHDGQVVGYVNPPTGMTYQTANTDANTLCQKKYSSDYVNAPNDVEGFIGSEADYWKTGFRYIECDVYRPDGKKITSSVVAQLPSTQPTSG